jgi:Icc-related predicted phosphoesterase
MVRALVIADEEANLPVQKLRDLAPKIVLSAGDLPWHYIEYVASCVDAPVVFVPGNHDPAIEYSRGSLLGLHLLEDQADEGPRPHGAINADKQIVEAAGLRIAGLGGCVRYKPGPHQYTQREYHLMARRLLRRARRAGLVDVLLTHAPPMGLGDGDDRPHEGIEALHTVLERLQPSWHLHGHIHPYGRRMPDRELGRTTIRNVIPWRIVEIEPRSPHLVVASGSSAGTM